MRKFFQAKLLPQAAWTDTCLAISMNILGMSLQMGFSRAVPEVPLWPSVSSVVLGCIFFLFMLSQRGRSTLRVCYTVFLLNSLTVIAALWVRDSSLAQQGMSWVPFLPNKLGTLIVGLLAPGFWIGLIGIAFHVISVTVHLEFLPSEIRSRTPVGEPLATLAFALAAVMVLISRYRRIQLEMEALNFKAQSLAAKNLALTVLRMRDLMNTPLQIVEFSVSLLRQKSGYEETALQSMENALEHLNELNRHMKKYEGAVDWSSAEVSVEYEIFTTTVEKAPERPRV